MTAAMLNFSTPENDPLPQFRQRQWDEIIQGAKGWAPVIEWFIAGASCILASCAFHGWVEFLWMSAGLALLSRYAIGWIRYHMWLTAQAFDENRWRMDWKETFEGKVARNPELRQHAEEWLKQIQLMRNCNDDNVKK